MLVIGEIAGNRYLHCRGLITAILVLLAAVGLGCKPSDVSNSESIEPRSRMTAESKDFRVVAFDGASAVEELNKFRAAWNDGRPCPFIIGDAEELSRVSEAASYADDQNQTLIDVVENSKTIECPRWFQDRKEQSIAESKEYDDEYSFNESEVFGDWPSQPQVQTSLTAHTDILTGKPKDKVFIGLSAVDRPWQLPAAVRYGGWNDCPHPAEHCAVLRYWEEKYGAEVVVLSDSVIECIVSKPPLTREEAVELAWQQYWYCPDIVEQGTENVAALAASLLKSNYWYFWWD